MSYLFDLVTSLNEHELKTFAAIKLTGKEEMVRNEYASHAKSKRFSEPALPAKLSITKSHFDKIVSVLLDKTLVNLAGKELIDKLTFAARKQLNGLVLHELKLTEKQLKKAKDKAALKPFYLQAFQSTLVFTFNDYPVKQLAHYSHSYVALLNKFEVAEKYGVLVRHQELLIRYYYPRKDSASRLKRALTLLTQWEKEIKGKNLYEVEMRLNIAYSAYYDIIDPPKCLEYLLKAEAAARKNYSAISDRDKAFLLLLIANMLIDTSQYKQAIKLYEEAFEQFSELIKGKIFHPFNFVFALLIDKNYERADEIMKDYIDPIMENDNARNFKFDILRLHAILHLLRHENEQAGIYLQQVMQIGKEDFTPLGDVLFRFVHNVYCVQTGDYALAADVLKKNLKFIQSKIDIVLFDVYKNMFLALGKVIRLKSSNKSLKNRIKAHELWPAPGKARLYQDLLELPFER